MRDRIRLVGSRCGRFGPALELLALAPLPLARRSDGRFPLGEAPAALEAAARAGCLKVLIEMEARS